VKQRILAGEEFDFKFEKSTFISRDFFTLIEVLTHKELKSPKQTRRSHKNGLVFTEPSFICLQTCSETIRFWLKNLRLLALEV